MHHLRILHDITRGQRPYCTYCNRLGHIRDRCYQSSEPPPLEFQPSPPRQGVTLTPDEYEKFLRLTHAAKSAFVVSLTLPNLLLLHRPVMPLPILHTLLVYGFSISVHLIIFLVLMISSSPLSMITLANETLTMAKEINSTRPLPFLPLASILYVPDSPFNLISISKLIHDLNCSITFSHSSVTL